MHDEGYKIKLTVITVYTSPLKSYKADGGCYDGTFKAHKFTKTPKPIHNSKLHSNEITSISI